MWKSLTWIVHTTRILMYALKFCFNHEKYRKLTSFRINLVLILRYVCCCCYMSLFLFFMFMQTNVTWNQISTRREPTEHMILTFISW